MSQLTSTDRWQFWIDLISNNCAIGHNSVDYHDGAVKVLGSKAEVQMQPGDVFAIETPSGGGYGENF